MAAMKTPTLNKSQQQASLSARKKKKQVIKNVLSTPYAKYWPLLRSNDAEIMQNVLRQHLAQMKRSKVAVPWQELKAVPKEQRKEYRLNYANKIKPEPPIDQSVKNAVVFGVNEVTKLIETNGVSSVLISEDVNPQFMVMHIVDMSVLKNIPVLIVPNLKKILKEKTGISALAIGLRINLSIDCKYWPIDQKIKEIHLNYPIPENHFNFHRQKLSSNFNDIKLSPMVIDLDSDSSTHSVIESKPANFLLFRKSKTERIFKPPMSKQTEEVEGFKNRIDTDINSMDFIALSDNDDEIKEDILEVPPKKQKISYKSLIVKRVTGNKNRNQKKIELLKRKR